MTAPARAALRWPLAAGVLSAAALVLALAWPATLRVDAGDADAYRVLRSFGAPLTRQQRAGRWSGPGSVLVLHGVGAGDSALTLEMAGGWSGRTQTVTLAAADGGRPVVVDPSSFEVGPDWREYAVRLDVAAWPPGPAPVELAIRAAPYRRGAQGEELGIRLGALSVRPLGGAVARAAAALPRVALWTWALAILAVVSFRLARRFGGPERAPRVAAVAVAAAGLVLALLAARDPHGLAWVLPVPLVLLALVTAALVLSSSTSRAWPRREAWAWLAALGALGALYAQRGGFTPAAVVLAGSMAWLLLVRRRADGRADGPPAETGAGLLTRSVVAAGIAVVVLAALAMRFAALRELPYGMWRDEARYGLVALRMIEDPGYRPAYVPEVVTLPGLGLRMLGLGLQLWGIASWAMRTVPALAGALTVIPLFGLARRLTGRADVALLAAAFLAVASWHVTVSRIISPAAMHPLFELTGLWCLVEALGIGRSVPPRPAWRAALLVAGGALVAVSLQTYHSGRSSPVMAAALLAAAWTARGEVPRRWSDLAFVAVGFLAAGAPLLAYAWRDAPALNARVGAVFLPAAASAAAVPPLAALDASAGRHLLMFNVRGEHNGRRNVPLRPMLDPVTGLGFLAGLLALWRARGDYRARFLLAALAVGVLPSAVAVEGPHALRAIGAAPFACIAAAVGWRDLADRAGWTGTRALGAGAALAAAALAWNAWTYFVVAPRDERVWGAFYTVETQVGTFVRDLARREGPAATERVYVSRETAESSVTELLVHGLTVQTFDDSGFSRPPAPGSLFVASRDGDRERVFTLAAQQALATPALAGAGPPLPDGRPAYTLYRLP